MLARPHTPLLTRAETRGLLARRATRAAVVVLMVSAALLPAPGARGQAVDPDRSWVVAVTDKGGALGFLGHRHAVLVTDWSVKLVYRPDAVATSSLEATVPAAALRIDTPRGRELAGLGGGPSPDDVADLQQKVLAANNLAASEHPELRFATTAVRPAGAGWLRVDGLMAIRGRSVPVSFPVRVEALDGGALRFSGRVTVKMSAFGIEPESIAGVVRVADPVEIRFSVVIG